MISLRGVRASSKRMRNAKETDVYWNGGMAGAVLLVLVVLYVLGRL